VTAKKQSSGPASKQESEVRLVMGAKKHTLTHEQAVWLGYKLLGTERTAGAWRSRRTAPKGPSRRWRSVRFAAS